MQSRRQVLKTVLVAGLVTSFSGVLPGLSSAAGAVLRVRRSLHGMALNDPDLATYRDFVGIMKGKDQTQALSWLGFANQHGSLEGGFKYCPHGDWYFLPWHRAFVLMYENAARKLTGNDKFAMPYWDWTVDRLMPSAFTNAQYQGKKNPLYVANRNPLTGANALTDSIVGPDVIKKAYQETAYEIFGTSRSVDDSTTPPTVQNDLDPKWVPMGGGTQGTLERTPHNLVHNAIGAFMPTAASPRDPIFMMHHGNIDRIWAHWNGLGRKNSTDPLWLDMPFTDNYLTPDGAPYTQKVKDLLSTEPFGYRYDDAVVPDKKPVNIVRNESVRMLFSGVSGVLADSKMQRVLAMNVGPSTVLNPRGAAVQLRSSTLKEFSLATTTKSTTSEFFALIRDIQINEDVMSIRVFVNGNDISLETPEADPHFVTTIGFLAHSGAEGHHAHKSLPSTIIDLTATLKQLAGAGKITNDAISIQLLPVPKPGVLLEKVGAVVPASIEIVVI